MTEINIFHFRSSPRGWLPAAGSTLISRYNLSVTDKFIRRSEFCFCPKRGLDKQVSPCLTSWQLLSYLALKKAVRRAARDRALLLVEFPAEEIKILSMWKGRYTKELAEIPQRPFQRMRTRIFLCLLFALLVIAVVGRLFFYTAKNQESLQIFPAAVKRDCAPWDGAAFTISIPIEESTIAISIYQSPDIGRPVTFSFPDITMQEGDALLIVPLGQPEPLTGNVLFQHVDPGKPVEGRFDLDSGTGAHFKGKFKAEWSNEIIYCG